MTKTSEYANEIIQLKETYLYIKHHKRKLNKNDAEKKYFKKYHKSTLSYFLIQVFDQDVLISLVGLSKFIEHTEANPAEYVEHTSLGHWQLA